MPQAKLDIGQRTVALDLAQALKEEEGTFLCQQAGQSYIAVSRAGHSIVSLRPVGRRFVEAMPVSAAQESWIVEKITNQEIAFDEQLQQTRGRNT